MEYALGAGHLPASIITGTSYRISRYSLEFTGMFQEFRDYAGVDFI